MARQIDNSLDRFVPGRTTAAIPLLAGGVSLVLLAVAFYSLAYGWYTLGGLVLFSLLGLAAFFYVSARERARLLGRNAARSLDWKAAPHELQRQNLNVAAKELARILEKGHESGTEIHTALIVAEDLALRRIQQEECVPVVRHTSVAGIPFDAMFIKGDALVCADVMFLVVPTLKQERVAAMLNKVAAVKRSVDAMNVGLTVRLMIVVSTQMSEDEVNELRRSLDTSRFESTVTDVDIRFLDFDELQRSFVSYDVV
jgi:hypothetical protein